VAIDRHDGQSRDLLPPALLTAKATTALAVGLAILVLVVVGGLVGLGDYSFRYYRNDPARTLSAFELVGLMSHAGVLLLWGAATIGSFSGVFVARSRDWPHAMPLLALALGAGYLAIDDLFLLHEGIYPDWLGVRERFVLLAYALAAFAFLWRCREFFRQHEWPLLALAGTTLALSAAMDEILPFFVARNLNWLEDSAKLFGLALLAAYLVRLSARMLAAAYPLASADAQARQPR
jgi:hypothetical protein